MSKELSTTDFILADWKQVNEELIREAVMKEGKPIIAKTLDMDIGAFYDWFKVRKIKVPIVRNFNYFNSRKPEAEREPYEDTLSKQILAEMIRIRDKRLKDIEDSYIEVVCPTCGKTFKTKREAPAKYCSQECVMHRVRSEEERDKISKAHIGKECWSKGKKMPEESVQKMRENLKKSWTEEKKELQRQKQKEIWSNPELIEKHKEIMKVSSGRPEVREKISNGLKEYNQSLTDEDWTKRYVKQYNTKKEKGCLFESSGEKSIKEFIESLGFSVEKYVLGKADTRFEIDCYVKDKKFGVEYNGVYFHSVNKGGKKKSYHFKKQSFANEQGIELMQVWEDQWINQTEIIKDIIAARLGIIRGEKIYARKCEIREVNTADYRDFCNTYHVQGYRSASVKLGLCYNNRLVQIASFNKARQYSVAGANQYQWEWVRGCISSNNKVIGGTSKLLKHFIDTYNPDNILCFSDWNLFSGNGYEESGFELEGYTGPDKFYITNSSHMQRINRNPYAYSMYKQMVQEGKLFECYGCGSKKFVWRKS